MKVDFRAQNPIKTRSPASRTDTIATAVPEKRVGRSDEQFRQIFMKTGVITQASGSSYIEIEKTKLICSVHGPRATHKTEEFESAKLHCELKYATFSAAAERSDFVESTKEKDYGLMIVQAIMGSLRLEMYPKTVIDIYVLVLNDDGGVLEAAITAASMALADAGVEMYDMVAACSSVCVGDNVLLDPTHQEEVILNSGHVLVAKMPSLNEITQLVQTGELSYSNVVDVCIPTNLVTSGAAIGTGSCMRVSCTSGFSCQDIRGTPICIPNHLIGASSTTGQVTPPPPAQLCHSSFVCPSTTTCMILNGNQLCIPTSIVTGSSHHPPGTGLCSNPLTAPRCPTGFSCQQVGTMVLCIPSTLVIKPPVLCPANYSCPQGTACMITQGREVCLSPSMITDGSQYPPGAAMCAELDAPECPANFLCAPDFICPRDTTCMITQGREICLPPSVVTNGSQYPPGAAMCAELDAPECPDSFTSGAAIGTGACMHLTCTSGFFCQDIRGTPICVPNHLNGGSTTTTGQVITPPPSQLCRSNSMCPLGTICMITQGREVCLPPSIATAGSLFPPGLGLCTLPDAPRCPASFVCQQIDQHTYCVPNSIANRPPATLCPENYPCPSGSTCVLISGQEMCYPSSVITGGSSFPPGSGICANPLVAAKCPVGFTCQQAVHHMAPICIPTRMINPPKLCSASYVCPNSTACMIIGTHELCLSTSVLAYSSQGTGALWLDENGDSTRETSDNIPLLDITITLTKDGETSPMTFTKPNSKGEYEILNLLAGKYCVVMTDESGLLLPTTPGSGSDIDAKGKACFENLVAEPITINGGFKDKVIPKLKVSGNTWKDFNSNGVKDTIDAPLAKVTVTLQEKEIGRKLINEIRTTESDNNGYYEFVNVNPGDYCIMMVDGVGKKLPTQKGKDSVISLDRGQKCFQVQDADILKVDGGFNYAHYK
eukprot:gene3728-4297_t